MKQSMLIATLAAALAAGPAHAAYTFEIDRFAVIIDNILTTPRHETPAALLGTSPIFADEFDNGTPPQLEPANYVMHGTMGPEANGLLSLDSSGAVQNAQGTYVQQAIWNQVLDNEFPPIMVGVFNFDNPGTAGGGYGVRFTDVGIGNSNDIVSLTVRGRTDGLAVVDFARYNLNTNVYTLIDRQVLELHHDQIGLVLANTDPDDTGLDPDTANDNDPGVYAAFFYLDDGVLNSSKPPFSPEGSFHVMDGSTTLYDGESFTRAAFFAADMGAVPVPVPEPATYAMLLAGLGLTGWVVRRQRRR